VISKRQYQFYIPFCTGIFVTLVFLIIGFTIIRNAEYRVEKDLKITIMEKAGAYRARLESALNSRLYIGQGFMGYIALHPAITSTEFQRYAHLMLPQRDPAIRNISILKNTVIVFAYPEEGNEKAIGVDLALIPAQKDLVLKAMHDRVTIIAGPVELVQGGTGVISRIPIISNGHYWGQVSVVIMFDALLDESGISAEKELRFAFRRVSDDTRSGEVFWGNASLFSSDSLILRISCATSQWEMAVSPLYGWKQYPVYFFTYRIFGIIFALCAGIVMWLLTKMQFSLRERATHDYLTGLPNRAFLYDRLTMALHYAQRNKKNIIVISFDLNKFKNINDSFGHAMGDEVLKALADRLSAAFRKTDTIARIGGDEFVIVITDVVDTGFEVEVAQKLHDLIEEPFVCKGKMLYVGVSIGIAVYPVDGMTVETLLKSADAAMYRSKNQ